MRPEVAKLLWDVRAAGERIARFTEDVDESGYLSDELIQAGVERQFEIIGEALGRLRGLDGNLAERIPDLAQIVAFRNRLIHGYAEVDARVVWAIATTRLPALMRAVEEFVARNP